MPSTSEMQHYEQAVASARERFGRNRFVREVVEGRLTPNTHERFLMWFSALGVQMTRPVDSWILRAGERCCQLELVELGEALIRHARHEAGHDALFRNDARALAARWNGREPDRVDIERLLAHAPTSGVSRYVELHERTIAGPEPYAQLAIEYEIEQLSVTWGPRFVAACARVLGEDLKRCLTFLEDHVRLDVGHTEFNRRQLTDVLDAHPDFVDAMVATGSEALDAYSGYLDDCLDLAGLPDGVS
jgi:hypothetical protein